MKDSRPHVDPITPKWSVSARRDVLQPLKDIYVPKDWPIALNLRASILACGSM